MKCHSVAAVSLCPELMNRHDSLCTSTTDTDFTGFGFDGAIAVDSSEDRPFLVPNLDPALLEINAERLTQEDHIDPQTGLHYAASTGPDSEGFQKHTPAMTPPLAAPSAKRQPRITNGSPCKLAGCGKIFDYAYALRQHEQNVHTAEDKKPFRCSECDKGFMSSKDLNRYVSIHDPERHKTSDCTATKRMSDIAAIRPTLWLEIPAALNANKGYEHNRPLPSIDSSMGPTQKNTILTEGKRSGLPPV